MCCRGSRGRRCSPGVTAAVAVTGDYAVATPASGTLALTRTYRRAWTVVVAILLFPIGLLALLVKERDLVTVNAEDTDDGVRVSAVGTGSDDVVSFLEDFLSA